MNKEKRFDAKTIKRLFGYIIKGNKLSVALVCVCIIINTVAVVAGSLYLQVLIDNYIAPLIGVENANLGTLVTPIMVMIGIYAVRNNNNIYIHKSNGKNITRHTKNNKR